MCKVPRCNIQLWKEVDIDKETESNPEKKIVFEGEAAKVRFEGTDEEEKEEQCEIEKRKTRSMTEVVENSLAVIYN